VAFCTNSELAKFIPLSLGSQLYSGQILTATAMFDVSVQSSVYYVPKYCHTIEKQGDQNGRFFGYWVVVYFVQFLLSEAQP
jgi:hypothetical protein